MRVGKKSSSREAVRAFETRSKASMERVSALATRRAVFVSWRPTGAATSANDSATAEVA